MFAPTGDPFAITNITAHFYYEESGVFDRANITAAAAPVLWNTIIGEGDARSPSGATLFLVQVRGSWVAGSNPPRVRLTVQDTSGETLLLQTVDTEHFFAQGPTIFVPFIAYGTGCWGIRATATLIAREGGVNSTLSTKVPFECGE
jgi:hypothetical protein